MNAQQQNFVGVRPSIASHMLTPKVRAALEYMSLFFAITMFCSLLFMHTQYVNQPACSSELSRFETTGAKLMLIKITSADLWLHNESEPNRAAFPYLKTVAVQWMQNKSKTFEPTYLFTTEKGYFLLPESAKSLHGIRSINISISARHSCFGNRWQQLLINRIVGYDTILIYSLLSSPQPRQGFLYSYHTERTYNLRHAQVPKGGLSEFAEKFVTKCGFLFMSFFMFFTTTMSASFILREAQLRMLKFAVELQQLALQGLPTTQLLLINGLELLVFVPIMIGIMFFMFEFYHDEKLTFMVLALVWSVELFVIISVRTSITMIFFPLFFLMYFLVFHIYFFLFPYGFSHLALTTSGACTLHLILCFWNRFEVPAFERLMMHILESPQNQGDVRIIQSTVIARMMQIRRLDAGGQDPMEGTNVPVHQDNPEQSPGQAEPVHD